MASGDTGTTNPYRLLPAVDEALREPAIEALGARVERELLAAFVQAALDGWRAEIKAKKLDAAGLEARLASGALAADVEGRVVREQGRGVRPAINATGVILHTNLGRAPVHPEAAEAMAAAARGYCVLEVDRYTGERNRRDDRLSELCVRLVGGEAAIAVNNNAAAAFLMMNTFAAGRQGIVSRGELVEIGGSFRVPDVMERAGVELVEVGATNRTRIADYARAIGPDTGLLMKVHSSNFRMVGFTEEVEPADMAALGREHGIATAWDLGSGLIERAGMQPLEVIGDETEVRTAVASGVDCVGFSGDKLLGGPQAGVIVGRRDAIHALRANPVYRAIRLDKVALAGLEATLGLILAGRGDELPVRAMLQAEAQALRPEAEALAQALARVGSAGGAGAVSCEVVSSAAQPGSGSAPGVEIASFAVAVTHAVLSVEALAHALRAGEPPLFGRIQEDRLLLDVRTLLPGQREALVAAFEAIPANG